ncbi:MAG: ATPase domain-containing protein [Candidatus Aenigmatarchaeota archaeon]
MERIATNIPGLDELLEGGIPKGFQILVAGEAGTGKTIFSCQFAYNQAKKGLKTYYLTIEESPTSIVTNMQRFSWGKEFEMFVKENKIIIERIIPLSIEETIKNIINAYNKYRFNFFILDTLTAAAMGWKELQDPTKLRRNMFTMVDTLKQYGVTSFLLSEIEEGSGKIFKYGFEGFIVDGVIMLRRFEYAKKLIEGIILKMRATNHSKEVFNVEIDYNGISIKRKEKGIII